MRILLLTTEDIEFSASGFCRPDACLGYSHGNTRVAIHWRHCWRIGVQQDFSQFRYRWILEYGFWRSWRYRRRATDRRHSRKDNRCCRARCRRDHRLVHRRCALGWIGPDRSRFDPSKTAQPSVSTRRPTFSELIASLKCEGTGNGETRTAS